MSRTITVRLPRAFIGANSASVRRWLLDFCRNPKVQLPLDPGPEPRSKRVSFSIPKRIVKFASAALGDESASACIRRIVAWHMMALPSARSFSSLTHVPGELAPSSVPHTRLVSIQPRYHCAKNNGWIPARSLEWSPAPVPKAQAALPIPAESNAPSESPMFGVWLFIGFVALAVWALVALFKGAPKGAGSAAPHLRP